MKHKTVVFIALGLAAAIFGALALTPVEHQVALLAPQVQALAGSPENFESLANGLYGGQTVTLTATGADGSRQIVAFTPAAPMSPQDIARTLEAARQALISAGVAAPDPAQLGTALVGGSLTLPGGKVEFPALVAALDPKHPIAIVVRPFAGSSENYQRLLAGLASGTAIRLQSAGNQAVSIQPPGGPMSQEEVRLAISLASRLLAQQGITDATPEQIRAALLGGTVKSASGQMVLVRGVLEGRSASAGAAQTSDSKASGRTSDEPDKARTSDTRLEPHTSDSPLRPHTSDSPLKPHTSDRPVRK